MKFADQYPDLANFLGAWFPDADLEGRTDEEVCRAYLQTVSAPQLEAVVVQAGHLLADGSASWEDVGREANRSFRDADEARQWLTAVVGCLKMCWREL